MQPTFDELHDLARRRLTPSALGHSDRVAETASWLAGLYGVDVEDARVAGLLHDWHRDTSGSELERRARERGLPVTEADCAVPYLLHGPLAAAELARDVPGLPVEVLDAIAAHTYGASEMSPLAMVVYVADVIEPDRDHTGVADLRESAGSIPLEELFARAYAASVQYLVQTRRHIHPVTVMMWNRFVADGHE